MGYPRSVATSDDQPVFLTVPEAAAMMRISRSHAYDMANQWILTKGREGIPAMKLGRRVLIHREKLLAWAIEQ
jgi:excisionase family DNA binding protein